MSAELHKQKGNEHFAAGNYEEAIKEYTTAIIHNPTEPKYFSNRAIAHFKFDNYEQCISDCQRTLELDQNSVKAYYYVIVLDLVCGGIANQQAKEGQTSIRIFTKRYPQLMKPMTWQSRTIYIPAWDYQLPLLLEMP